MHIRESILLLVSRNPNQSTDSMPEEHTTVNAALDNLKRYFPDLRNLVEGRRIADFGCGVGMQSIALVENFGCNVVGIDTNPRILAQAKTNAAMRSVSAEQLRFAVGIDATMHNSFDVVISQNSFEHFHDPAGALCEMVKLLNVQGRILLTFGPPWFSPYGSHMQFFCKLPWLNILFPEDVVMRVRGRFRDDGATRYEDVESGLNRMSIAKFESIVASCNLNLHHKNYTCIKGISYLSKLPTLRELFINNVSVILTKNDC